MAKAHEVLLMLCDGAAYTLIGEEYEDINWHGSKPAITKAQYVAGFQKYDEWKLAQDSAKAAAKAALLERLGITEDEAKLLLG
jgi:hypothetical protein